MIEIKWWGMENSRKLIFGAGYTLETSQSWYRVSMNWYLALEVNLECQKLIIFYILGPIGQNCPQPAKKAVADGENDLWAHFI